MRKIFILLFLVMLVPSIVSATVNLDFRLDVEEKGFYPNEEIPLDVTVINRDSTFSARDAELTVYISDRFYTFDLGDLEPDETFEKEIILPEFPPGTHTIKGEINYTGVLDEKFIETSYGSFEVLFPPIERYPRNVYVSSYDLPEKIIGGKSYNVSITITNDGEVNADLLIEFGSLDEFFTEETTLDSDESKTVKMTVEFENPGVSLIEARVYALINGEKYLLNYRGKKTYVQEERKAKLSFDKIEFVDEIDNKINQKDTVKFKILIKNDGKTAIDVVGELFSATEKIDILDSDVSYVTITNKDSVAPTGDVFEIETKGIEVGDHELNLKLIYIDTEGREKEIKIPITINEGGDFCNKDADCSEIQACENNQCADVSCECGEIKDHKCSPYECCSDIECGDEDLVCDLDKHQCEVPIEFQKDVIIMTVGNKLDKTDKYDSILKEYREILQEEGLSSFYIELDSSKLKKFFNIELKNPEDWIEVRDITHKIVDKTNAEYILILGGVGVIPQPFAKTEAKIPEIPVSDDRYVDLDFDGLPDVALGRIPTPAGDSSVDIIITALNSAIDMRKKESISKVEFAEECLFPSCSTRDVDIISKSMFDKKCSESSQCYFEPPYCSRSRCDEKDKFYQELINGDVIHIASHASPWSFGLFHSPKILYEKPFSTNPLFFTIGCHSGTIDCEEYGCIKEDGSVFAFLANGASIYIGNTRYGYGNGLTAGYLDTFYSNLERGETSGKAMLSMKREELENSWSDFSNAVIYEIQLYGDPTLKINI